MLSSLLYFLFSAWLQLIAFWADQIWSLSAIVRFITGLLGGSLLPLSLFPETLRGVLTLLPFSYFVHFPLQCFFGNIPLDQWLHGISIMGCWSVVFAAIYAAVWNRGNLQYTGVGI
jgi:ABC-2 type transport system permease protein